jgi:enoyl-CoA hydratase/carnithine racemase
LTKTPFLPTLKPEEPVKLSAGQNTRWCGQLSHPNAVRPQTMQEICEATDRFTADPAIAGIGLIGNGDHFLAGADFEFLEETAAGSCMIAYDKIYTHFQGAARRLFRCQKPTVAAISGAAITVGCELSLTCDARVADETAFFEESWLRLGLIPPLGGAMLLPRFIGLARAKEMILEGRRIESVTARTGWLD